VKTLDPPANKPIEPAVLFGNGKSKNIPEFSLFTRIKEPKDPSREHFLRSSTPL
jgi:hypothetical protein